MTCTASATGSSYGTDNWTDRNRCEGGPLSVRGSRPAPMPSPGFGPLPGGGAQTVGWGVRQRAPAIALAAWWLVVIRALWFLRAPSDDVRRGRRRARVAGGVVQSRAMWRATQSAHLRQM